MSKSPDKTMINGNIMYWSTCWPFFSVWIWCLIMWRHIWLSVCHWLVYGQQSAVVQQRGNWLLSIWAASFWETWDMQQSPGNLWLRGKIQSSQYHSLWLSVYRCSHWMCVSAHVSTCVRKGLSRTWQSPACVSTHRPRDCVAASNIPDIFVGFE